jgi:glycosyltransferase involved in cell wall biosynthesis
MGFGLHVAPEDPEALRKAMQQILDDPISAEAMGRQGREWCEKRYNIQRYARELHEVFAAI